MVNWFSGSLIKINKIAIWYKLSPNFSRVIHKFDDHDGMFWGRHELMLSLDYFLRVYYVKFI